MKTGVEVLKKKVELLPHRPGVYRMVSEVGKVLYVGKAKNLKKRVTSYTKFDQLPDRLKRMVSEMADLIVVETANEAEAFLLENDLIKQYYPYYNILLKDDKGFPYIFVGLSHDFPRVSKYRGSRKEKGEYFGPYASIPAVNEALMVLQKVFLLRTCSDSMFSLRTRPCLLYQIKRCSAPCVGCISKEEYAILLKQARDFMNGKNTDIQKKLTEQMYQKSEAGEYESALVLRNRITALNHMQSYAVGSGLSGKTDADFMAIYKQDNMACIQVFFYRRGQNGGTHAFFVNDVKDETLEAILTSFIGQFYQTLPTPHELILSHMIEEKEEIEEALTQKYNHPLKIVYTVKEGRRQLLNRAEMNAKEALIRKLSETGNQKERLQELADLMGLLSIQDVEVYDNSHIQGVASVGALIVADEKGFNKKKYRRFNIERAVSNDDFGMMKEVLERRLTRGVKENSLPSAILIDGGLGQLSSVMEIMNALNIHVPVMAVAKGPERDAGKEKLYLPSSKDPIILEHNSLLLHFIQRLRDEAHRFAIGSHRTLRKKVSNRRSLDDIEGVGAVRRKQLIAHFGTPKAVSEASIAELMQVSGISEKMAKNIYTFFNK